MAREKQHSTQKTPIQAWETNTRTTPVAHEKTMRRDEVSVVTSSYGGKLVPLKSSALLREDGLLSSTVTVNVQMAETAKMLLNPVRVAAAAYLVPKLAFERFKDMGQIDRSYNGQQEVDTNVIPWFETTTWPALNDHEIYKALGLHGVPGELINRDYETAYNCLWNYIAANRSPSLTPRAENDATLAPAFWANTQMKHVVPTFDEALIEGRVPLNLVGGTLAPVIVQEGAPGDTPAFPTTLNLARAADDRRAIAADASSNLSNLVAEMADVMAGSISLADIDLARETAAWARLRTQYQGKSEEWMMDQLLAGMRIPDEGLKQPILLDTQETIMGMSQRYATDSGNLQKSVTDGRTSLQLRLRSPVIPCGGVVMIVAQALPEQVYERQIDYYLGATEVKDLPNRISDELDPQPVSMVANKEVDVKHTAKDGLFGYAPLNHKWTGGGPNVGGRYYRPDPDAAWDEDRNRIWDSAVKDPSLGPDFYLATTLHHNVFQTQNEEPFEWWCGGRLMIEGLTYFGPSLRESKDDYQKVLAKVDTGRLKGDGTDDPLNPPTATESVLE